MKPTLTTNTNETKGRQRQPARLPAVCQHADAERERPTRCHLDCRGHRPRSRCLRTGKLNSNHIFFFSSLKMTLFHIGFLFSIPFLFFGIVSLLFSPWYFLLKFSFIIQRQLTHIDRRRKRKNNSDSRSHVTAHTYTGKFQKTNLGFYVPMLNGLNTKLFSLLETIAGRVTYTPATDTFLKKAK